MNVVTKAIYDKLNGDATLTALLGTYASLAAIFEGPTIPEAANSTILPCILIRKVDQTYVGAKSMDAWEMVYDIMCVNVPSYDTKALSTIAQRVVTLLHKVILTVTGYDHIISVTSGPFQGPTEDHRNTLIVSLRLTITE